LAFLLDTNIIIWLGYGIPKLPTKVAEMLLSGSEPNFISVVSGWEYEQKRKLRPDEFSLPFSDVILEIPHQPLDLEFEVSRYASSLPLIHRDPFDRMLIAQAIHHDLEFIASDEAIHKYPVRIFW
jgi:PIN domain nuclease of toxin-antitoxin system